MIQSMTAFSRSQNQVEAGLFCWEIRSVNHRYLDVSFRMPESFRNLESNLRSLLKDKVNRGKIECQLKFQDTSSENRSMLINIGMVNALLDVSSSLADSHHLANDMNVSTVLAWPGVVVSNSVDTEALEEYVLQGFNEAIEGLCEARATEGKTLKLHVEGKLQALSSEVQKCKRMLVNVSEMARDKLLTRLQAVRLEVSEARVEQEIALILTRLDVSEELDRLETHITEVSRTLKHDRVIGRRLDFLMQELNREANTLSSKSDSVELTQSALEMKVLIEQMREQIQNFE